MRTVRARIEAAERVAERRRMPSGKEMQAWLETLTDDELERLEAELPADPELWAAGEWDRRFTEYTQSAKRKR